MVQAAQEWLNSTYSGYAWFEPIPPDRMGKTGWTTMFALTRALQFELGIAPSLISDSFGPTTTERFTVQVGVISAATKPNIIKILQGALWCKGYTGGQLTGTYSPQTQVGVSESLQDMGFTTRLEVDARVMKAILTMDAYVVVMGGSADIRAVQQWMNRTYRDHVDYAIIPCDGHYSRYVQKMLVYAIQWALNVSGANGNYGPGTRNAVRTSGTVQQGSTGRLTQLFIAALYFNRYNPGAFGGTFTASVAAEVRKMQAFERLPATGKGDYATWSSLLVSNGDPLRPVTGIDTRFWITAEIAADLKTNGYTAVGRYLANSKVANPLDKKLRPGEVETIINAGLSLFPIWQMSGTSADHFSGSQALLDIDGATTAAYGFGIPQGSIIYFAVDFDAIDLDIDSNVLPYFRTLIGEMRRIGSPYLVGVYGSRNVCARVSAEAGAVSSFVSGMSTGFSGNLGFSLPQNWAFNQINEANLVLNGKNYYQNGTVVAVDNDVVSGRDPGVRSLTSAGDPNRAFIDYVRKVDSAITDWWVTNGSLSDPAQQLLAYLRSPEYDTFRWDLTGGPLQPGAQEAANAVAPSVQSYINVQHGRVIDRQHFSATASGVYQNAPSEITQCSRADLAGWVGDLLSLVRPWRLTGQAVSLYSFLSQRLGTDDGGFSEEDLIQDVDGYLVGIGLRDDSSDPYEVFNAVLSYPANGTNFTKFFARRFGSSVTNLRAAIRYAARSEQFEFKLMRARDQGDVGGPLGQPLTAGEADELADAFIEYFTSY